MSVDSFILPKPISVTIYPDKWVQAADAKAVDGYDYVGMVEALKTYSGDTITDKFYDFATTGCGVSTDIITSFRNLMLE